MKQFMLDLMSAMMPAMMPLVWAGSVLAAVSILLLALKRAKPARWGAGLTMAVGAFFLASQGMGTLLGAQPSINFGDAKQMEFILVPFWQIGLALAFPGAAVWLLSHRRRGDVLPG
ncbi:MAG: hypothetical protein ABEK42_06270 [Thiohalorhabdaceae bacterium]